MNIYPRLHRSSVASLAILAILTFLSLASPTSAQGSTLTPDLLNKLLDLVAKKGASQEVPLVVANALGLSAPGQGWPNQQVGIPVPGKPGYAYIFGVGTGTAQDVIFVLAQPAPGVGHKMFIIRSHRDGNAVAALIYITATGQVTMMLTHNVQKELDAEITGWADAFANPK